MLTTKPTPLTQKLGYQHPLEGDCAPVEHRFWKRARYRLGAQLHEDGASVTFAVYSQHATRMMLEIYRQPIGEDARYDYWMVKGDDGIWRARIAWNMAAPPLPNLFYGLRCWGPNWPFHTHWRRGSCSLGLLHDVDNDGNRFNPNKVLVDPYAKEFSHDRETSAIKALGHHAGAYGTGAGQYRGMSEALNPLPRREVDTGRFAPKAVFLAEESDFGIKPKVPQKDTVIYEAHLRGLTRHPSSGRLRTTLKDLPGFEGVANIPSNLRGTYLGAGLMAKYLKAMGYTSLELLPVHETANDLNPDGENPSPEGPMVPPHGNYWGYMTYGFFAPDVHFATKREPGAATREFKQMAKAFHDQGLEIYLDVVYNHHGEGGLWRREDGNGPDTDTAELISLRGLDNARYYALTDDKRHYWDSTGCGNNLDGSKRPVQDLIKDSLVYWSEEMGVDGFRFDLATVLGRGGEGSRAFSGNSDLLEDIATLAHEHGFKIIAEAWDTGGDGYHVGGFPLGWAEWNGRYRDQVRRFLKGDANTGNFVRSLNGDYDQFADQGGPQKSVNFITAHDGFTLLDLVSYDAKNNGIPWPFGPSDGGNDNNDSWSSGGDQNLRRQRLRNFFLIQFLSRGVPMTVAGDEYGRTQNGNNNPYKMDTVGLWQNWDMLGTSAPTQVPVLGNDGNIEGPSYHDNYGRDGHALGHNGFFAFTRAVLALRKAHSALRQDRYADLTADSGGDVTYSFKREDGRTDLQGGERSLSVHMDGSEVGDEDFLVFINMQASPVTFALPPAKSGRHWLRLFDTATWAEPWANHWNPGEAETIIGNYGAHAWSVVVLLEPVA